MDLDAVASGFQNSLFSAEEGISSTGGENDLGRDQFLTLLVTQLKNQDPLNPMESTEFTTQLAQYSSLEQLFNVNENLDGMRSSQEQNARYQALSFIGKEVVARGDMMSLEAGGTSKGGFTLPSRADCMVLIKDPKGIPVGKISLGVLEPGEHAFQWDGSDGAGNRLQADLYQFEIAAITETGQMLAVDTHIVGQVGSVSLEGDVPVIYTGGIPISLSQVLDVRATGSTGGTPTIEGISDSEI